MHTQLLFNASSSLTICRTRLEALVHVSTKLVLFVRLKVVARRSVFVEFLQNSTRVGGSSSSGSSILRLVLLQKIKSTNMHFAAGTFANHFAVVSFIFVTGRQTYFWKNKTAF
jgi:hypothetical protein